MRGQFFGGNERDFQQALADGEIRETVGDDGRKYYAWREYVAGTEAWMTNSPCSNLCERDREIQRERERERESASPLNPQGRRPE